MYTDPRINAELEVVLDQLDQHEMYDLVEKLAVAVQRDRKEANYREAECLEARQQANACDCESLQSRIMQLEAQLYAAQSDKTYWKSVAEQRQATIDSAMLKHSKEQCALGVVNLCQPYYKQMLDALFLDTPDYKAAWANAPWQLINAVLAISKDKKIERIKVVCTWLPGLGLKAAKDFVEAHWEYKQ